MKAKVIRLVNSTQKPIDFRGAAVKLDFEEQWSETDINEREFGDKIVEITVAAQHPPKNEDETSEGLELDATESHPWSPTSHYLEPFL